MPKSEPKGTSLLLTLAALIIIIAGVKTAQPLLVPFLLAFFISIICAGPFFWLQQHKIPAPIALLMVISTVMLGGVIVVTLIGTSVNDFTTELPVYQEQLQGQTIAMVDWLDKLGIKVSKQLLLEHFNPGAAMQSAAHMLATAGGVLTNSFMILLTVIFILLEAAGIPKKLHAALPDANSSLASFEKFSTGVRQYLAIKTLVSLGTGLVVTVGLLLLGLDYAPLWGMIAFLLNYIPNIGSIIAAVPAVLLAVVQLGPIYSLLVAVLYLVTNVIMGNAIEPRLMGQKLGLSALVIFISLVFWGWVLGPVGMLLSVPLTMVVKIALEVNESTRWIAILLSSEAPDNAIVRD
ncbi:MAG: AI-2E family transporter [Desulfuromonadales bacterium]|nr:AI-2E family transporter [Desulfuromonadales bacterium]